MLGDEPIDAHGECVVSGDLRVCAPKSWIELAKNIAARLGRPVKVASKLSLYRRLLLRVLGIKVYGQVGDSIVWAIINDGVEVVNVELTELDWFVVYSSKLPRVIALALAEPVRVLVFALVGVSGVPVNLAASILAYTMIRNVGVLAYPIASSIGFETSVVWNFALHESVTFRGRGMEKTLRKVLSRLIKYHIASVISYVSQVTVATILPIFLGFQFWLAQFLGIVVGFLANFILGYAYTWSMHLLRGEVLGAQAQEVRLR